ncbi:MAG: hypothetical protein H6719_24265 [Sandaracinaceae bacterium]|nr:hypothetical protein [Sandaracinaceae bacterium]
MNQLGTDQASGNVDPQDAETNKIMAVLSYFGIFLIIPYLKAKDSPFVKFHLNQGIILLVVGFAGSIGLGVVGAVLGMVLGDIGSMIGSLLSAVWSLATFVLFVLGVLNALGGRAKQLPAVGGLFTALK